MANQTPNYPVTPPSAHEVTLRTTEKNAIIAMQAIFTARGVVPDEKYHRLSFYLSQLPAHRALLVYGHAIHAVAARLEKTDPYKAHLERAGRLITEQMGPNYVAHLERDADFYEQQRPLLAQNLQNISKMFSTLADHQA